MSTYTDNGYSTDRRTIMQFLFYTAEELPPDNWQAPDWETPTRGTLAQEYQCYMDAADNGQGLSVCDGKPLKTFDEWLAS